MNASDFDRKERLSLCLIMELLVTGIFLRKCYNISIQAVKTCFRGYFSVVFYLSSVCLTFLGTLLLLDFD